MILNIQYHPIKSFMAFYPSVQKSPQFLVSLDPLASGLAALVLAGINYIYARETAKHYIRRRAIPENIYIRMFVCYTRWKLLGTYSF